MAHIGHRAAALPQSRNLLPPVPVVQPEHILHRQAPTTTMQVAGHQPETVLVELAIHDRLAVVDPTPRDALGRPCELARPRPTRQQGPGPRRTTARLLPQCLPRVSWPPTRFSCSSTPPGPRGLPTSFIRRPHTTRPCQLTAPAVAGSASADLPRSLRRHFRKPVNDFRRPCPYVCPS